MLHTWELETRKIADGIYASFSEGTIMRSNCALISGDTSSLLFDALATVPMLERFLNDIDDKFSPIGTLVLSHGHGDHTLSAHVVDSATIIAHESITDMLISSIPIAARFEQTQPYPGMDFTGCRVTMPDIYIKDQITINLGNRDVLIKHAGTCHTPHDLYAYDKKSNTVLCGDLMFKYITPTVTAGNTQNWICAMNELIDLDADVYVPGHGPVCQKSDLIEFRDYLSMMIDIAKEGLRSGIPAEELVRCSHWGAFADWAEPGRTYDNMDKVYAELQNTPYVFNMDFTRAQTYTIQK